LRRESIRLTQIQDIAGCRLIVSDIAEQERVVQSLNSLFEHTTVIDRRQRPSHGYRAVHVLAGCQGKLIEIQVRTSLQHLWAELSEKLSDVVDSAIKYGGGDENVQAILTDASFMVVSEESLETKSADLLREISTQGDVTDETKQQIVDLQAQLNSLRQQVFENLRDYIAVVEKRGHVILAEKLKGENYDLSD
jgi:putative GTP pyrophosphokinase